MTTEDALIALFTKFKWPAPTSVWVDREYTIIYFNLGQYRYAWTLECDGHYESMCELDRQGWVKTPMSERTLGLLQGKVRDNDGNLVFPEELTK
jgi:hypothetical protein